MTHSRSPVRTAAPDRRPAQRRVPTPVSVGAARALQRRVGNQGVPALLEPVQQRAAVVVAMRGARVSSPGEPAELEAESTAKQIMRSSATPEIGASPEGIARKADAPPTVSPNLSAAIASHSGSGAPLPTSVLNFMQPRFKADFSRVRIHTGQSAARMSAQLHAQAFTVGNNIFFGSNQFKPDTQEGLELIAHELTHTIQQGASVQRSAAPEVRNSAPEQVQRDWLPNPIDYAAEKANFIPGFRMLTVILGFNPITMTKVERGAANVLRAMLEMLPGGALLTTALDNSGIFDKVGTWIEQRVATLGMAAGTLKRAIDDFVAGLSPADLLDLGAVWDRAKHIITTPIDRLIDFGKTLFADMVAFVKEALLLPLAGLAEKLPAWPLLTAVLGKNPITGEAVPRTADTLIGGFLKLIGQEEVWENMQKAGAVPRVWAWFQVALRSLIGFVGQLPALAMTTLKSLALEDIVLLPRAFAKVGAVFGGFVAQFIDWAGKALWTLLEIVADAISPGAFGYIKKTGAALRGILKNPMPFVGNLVKAAKQGFLGFAGNFLGHLKAGLMDWLLGALPGVYIPKAFSLGEIVKFAFSVLGIGWQNIRQKLVKVVGEPAVAAMETGFDIVKTLVTDGPAAAWDKIKEQLAELQDKVIGGIVDFVVDVVVKKAVPKLVAMFIPGAGFISAIMSIYETVMVFVEKIARIVQVVKGFIDSIVAIAGGAIGAAASKVEGILAGLLSLAINFLAGFVGLGKVADKVMGVIGKVRATIDKALDALINWIVTMAKKLFAKVFGKKEKGSNDPQHDTKVAAGLAAVPGVEKKYLVDGELTLEGAEKVAAQIKKDHPIFKAFTVKENKSAWQYNYVASVGKVEGATRPTLLIVSVKEIKEKTATSPSKVEFTAVSDAIEGAIPGEAAAPAEFEKAAAKDVGRSFKLPVPSPRQRDRFPPRSSSPSGLPAKQTLLSEATIGIGGETKVKKRDAKRRPDFVVLAPGRNPSIEIIEVTLDASFSAGREKGLPRKRVQISETAMGVWNRYKGVPIIYTVRCPRKPSEKVIMELNADLGDLRKKGIDVQIVWVYG